MRHEMLNFLRNLHAYVAAQVLEVSWSEFQDNLNSKVNSLDELIDAHNKYVNRALFRCLLNQKAAPVMKIITDILNSITNFSRMVSTIGVGRIQREKKIWRVIGLEFTNNTVCLSSTAGFCTLWFGSCQLEVISLIFKIYLVDLILMDSTTIQSREWAYIRAPIMNLYVKVITFFVTIVSS